RAGTANGHDLGVRGRVVAGRHLVPSLGDDCVVADDERAERSAAVRAHFFEGKRGGAPHKCLFAHHDLTIASTPMDAARLPPVAHTRSTCASSRSSRVLDAKVLAE